MTERMEKKMPGDLNEQGATVSGPPSEHLSELKLPSELLLLLSDPLMGPAIKTAVERFSEHVRALERKAELLGKQLDETQRICIDRGTQLINANAKIGAIGPVIGGCHVCSGQERGCTLPECPYHQPMRLTTDAMIQPVDGRDCVTGDPIPVVHADDCRAMEAQLRSSPTGEQIEAISYKHWRLMCNDNFRDVSGHITRAIYEALSVRGLPTGHQPPPADIGPYPT